MESEGPFAVEFVEKHCRITQGMKRGELMQLLPFQKDVITELLELENGKRRYRRAYLQAPRKSGKSQLLACLSLYFAVVGEPGGEVYFVATARDQARIIFDRVKDMVKMDPELSELFQVYQRHMEIPSSGTVLRVLSSDAGVQQGLTPSFVAFDEVAFQRDSKLWDSMSLGMQTREEPLLVGISTPGWSNKSLARRLYDHGLGVRSGLSKDPTFYFRSFEAPMDCDHRDPKAWRKANPAVGHFVDQEAYASALATTHEMEFRRFMLGQWTRTESKWLDPDEWDACDKEAVIPSGSRGVILGLDVGYRRDSSAAVLVRQDGDEYHALFRVWSPGPDEDVDLGDVEDYIRECARRYPRLEVVLDMSMFVGNAQRLMEAGINVVEVPQTAPHMVKATSILYEAVREGKLRHGGDEVAREHALNAAIKSTPRGSWVTHGEDGQSMDAMTALAMALYRVVDRPPERKSAYEAGGLRTV